MRKIFLFIFFSLALIETSCSLNESDSELCFVGDSITYMWDLEYYFPSYYIHKHAVGGAKIQDIDNWNLSDCNGIPTVLLMGTNDIGGLSIKRNDADKRRLGFVEKFIPRIQKIGADPLWVVSILPRNLNGKQSGGVNQNIKILNNQIRERLESLGKSYKFIDVFDSFLAEDYQINTNLFKDGLHLTVEGYEILSSSVQGEL